MFLELIYYSTYQFLVLYFIIGVRFNEEKCVHVFFSTLSFITMLGIFANKFFLNLEVMWTTPKWKRMQKCDYKYPMYAYRDIKINSQSSLQLLICIFIFFTLEDFILHIREHPYLTKIIFDGQKNKLFLLFPLQQFSKEMRHENSVDVRKK